ncbi:MarR family winged helix-turn-helix transcriptional regulator [Pararoseomonas sp. SCSIO 73927]|uniref:MarR family winged helix-turn-helix transcriptional regulator n=1 Tax=Pararoseomonas sp. SCSIO 73927 TaxID=3114537 RepID=UPI0030D447CE
MREIYGMPGHLIRRAQQISGAIFAEEVGEHDLTSVQFSALFAIRAYPGVDATRLSALIAFDRSTLGGVLERLEAKGWILREPAPADRRAKRLRLTGAGAELLLRVEEPVRRVQDRLLAPLPPADRETFLRLIAQLADLHNEVTPAPIRRAAEGQPAPAG